MYHIVSSVETKMLNQTIHQLFERAFRYKLTAQILSVFI